MAARRLLEYAGVADWQALEAAAVAYEEWARHPDACYMVPYCEAVAWKDQPRATRGIRGCSTARMHTRLRDIICPTRDGYRSVHK